MHKQYPPSTHVYVTPPVRRFKQDGADGLARAHVLAAALLYHGYFDCVLLLVCLIQFQTKECRQPDTTGHLTLGTSIARVPRARFSPRPLNSTPPPHCAVRRVAISQRCDGEPRLPTREASAGGP
eukprot:scaffold54757_cov71-Phaeocystis_antarctica.AAC.4